MRKINRQGVTVILVEQNARAALKLASRGYVIEVGRVVMEDASEALLANPDVQAAYLGGGQENGQENCSPHWRQPKAERAIAFRF